MNLAHHWAVSEFIFADKVAASGGTSAVWLLTSGWAAQTNCMGSGDGAAVSSGAWRQAAKAF
jgi:hypothetical protein